MKLINFGVRQHSSFSSRARFCGGPSGQPRQGCIHWFIAPRLLLKRKERLVGLNANALESHHRATCPHIPFLREDVDTLIRRPTSIKRLATPRFITLPSLKRTVPSPGTVLFSFNSWSGVVTCNEAEPQSTAEYKPTHSGTLRSELSLAPTTGAQPCASQEASRTPRQTPGSRNLMLSLQASRVPAGQPWTWQR